MIDHSMQAAIKNLKSHGIVFENGLTESELENVEQICNSPLPPEYRQFLGLALPVSGGFPNWRSESDVVLRRLFDRPWDGLKFDIEHNDFWSESWGPRPQLTSDAIEKARICFDSVPVLIPVRSHHYIPVLPASGGTPVVSVRQSDTSIIGDTLTSYLADLPDSGQTRQIGQDIPFWSEVAQKNRIKVPNLSEDHVGQIGEYEAIRESIIAQGRYAQVARLINGTGIRLFHETPSDDRDPCAFWLSKRTCGWLLCIGGPRCFHAPQTDRIFDLCLTLLEQLPEGERKVQACHLDHEIRREFSLIAIKPRLEQEDERESRLRFLESIGWREMSDGHAREVWDEFQERLDRPNSNGFHTPKPTATWDISFAYIGNSEFLAELEQDLSQKALAALQDCVKPGEELFALDWNHSCYFFEPHGGMTGEPLSSWAMPILPNGDSYNFVTQDFRLGIIGNCVDQTICVFGEQLLDALTCRKPRLLKKPTWSAEERLKQQHKWAAAGWTRLSHDEKDERWGAFGERFQFFDRQCRQQGPRILEPSPSITWDISRAFASGATDRERMQVNLTRKVLNAMCKVTGSEERFYSFDATRWYEHYSFFPHRLTSVGRDEWALPVFPADAFTIFVTSGMECGLFGDPLDQTICIFGHEFLEAIRADLTELFENPIRINGQL